MNTQSDPREIAEAILNRSVCSVQVGACIKDKHGVFSWGWNSSGSGFGEHAEAACIRRANKKRLKGSIMYVASKRRRNGKMINSYPCPDCRRLIRKYQIHVKFTFPMNNRTWIYAYA
jgi:deoxycytidylate deaminase